MGSSVSFDVRRTTVWTTSHGTAPFHHKPPPIADTRVLENAKTHPDHLRTAEGRRRERDLKLLVSRSDPGTPRHPHTHIYTHALRPPDLLLHAAYDLIYIYIYLHYDPTNTV